MNAEDLAVRKAVFGKALCFLRLVRGIHSLRMADRIYRERIRSDAAPTFFAAQLSKWERGTDPSSRAILDVMCVLEIRLSDLETALDIMAMVEVKGVTGLRRSYAQNKRLRGRIDPLVVTEHANDDKRAIVISAAEEAYARS